MDVEVVTTGASVVVVVATEASGVVEVATGASVIVVVEVVNGASEDVVETVASVEVDGTELEVVDGDAETLGLVVMMVLVLLAVVLVDAGGVGVELDVGLGQKASCWLGKQTCATMGHLHAQALPGGVLQSGLKIITSDGFLGQSENPGLGAGVGVDVGGGGDDDDVLVVALAEFRTH